MKNKKEWISLIALVLFIACFITPIVGEASESLEVPILVHNNNKISGIVIKDTNEETTVVYSLPAENISFDGSPYSPMALLGYSIRNVRSQYTIIEPYVIRTSTLASGGSYTFRLTHSMTTTLSGGFGVGAKDFNVTLGISNSNTVTLSDEYYFPCPLQYGGKNVNSCSVKYYPEKTRYSFDVYFLGTKSGSYIAYVMTGFTQYVTYSYSN